MTNVTLHLPKSIVRKLDKLPTKRGRERIIKDILAVLCGDLKPAPSYMILTVHPPYYPLGE